MPTPPELLSTAELAAAVHSGVRTGMLDVVDVEAVLLDADDWVTRSDSPIAEHLRRRHHITQV